MLARIKAEIEDIDRDLNNLVEVTAQWFLFLKKKYGEDHPRLTEIRSFDTIVASKVAEANQKLYINRADGFIGTSLKKDEFVCNCSDIDDIILFYRDGTYKIIKAADKVFVGETEKSKREKRKAEIIHVAVFKKGDKRTIFNVCYKDGASGVTYIKRFNVTSLTRDREYDVTMGTPKSRITYLTANYNGEAEIIKVTLKPKEKLKRLVFEKDFSEIAIKGRASRGNQLTKHDVYRIQLKSHGGSTLGGRKVWFDQDVQRINYDEQGIFLGEFHNDDRILVVMKNGDFYLTDFDINNHYEKDMLVIEKFNPDKVWTAVLFDADNDNYPYIKRFVMEATNKVQNFLGNPESKLLLLSDIPYPRLELTFLEPDTFRGPLEIDAEEFIAVKGFKAKGKRLTTYALDQVTELEPTRFPEPEEDDNPDDGEEGDDDEVDDVDGNDTETDDENNNDPDDKSDDEIRDELTGQLRLF